MLRQLAATMVMGALLFGCAGSESVDENGRCLGKCDDPSATDSLAELDDPIADWLRESEMTEDGLLATDYMDVVREVATQMDCDMDTMRTFVLSDVLLGDEPFPRVISTLCSDQPSRAGDFFIAASFANAERSDVDVRNLEMFAWDKTARTYRFYAALPLEGRDELQIEVEPRRCKNCHLNANDLDSTAMPLLPIMNELTTPWPHWNAEPDFPSHTFELPPVIADAENYAELTGEGRLASAGTFEQIIRSAQSNRSVAARVRSRRNPASIDEGMALLRPFFCAEQINYMSEDHNSGIVSTDVVIPAGTGDVLRAVAPNEHWAWQNDGIFRLPPPNGDALLMMPVRGAADVEFEQRMLGLGAISAEDLLRIRALDWQKHVFSSFRCDLWRDARARLRQSPIEIGDDEQNRDILPRLMAEIMTLDGKSLVRDEGLIVMSSPAALREALELDDLESNCEERGVCLANPKQFGDMLQGHVDNTVESRPRETLNATRDTLLCSVKRRFENHPALPSVPCTRDARLAFPDALAQPKSMTPGEAPLEMAIQSAGGLSRQRVGMPDEGTIESTLDIENDAVLASRISVRVAIAHPWRGDLSIELMTPDGQRVAVTSFEAGDSADDVDGLFEVDVDPTLATGTWTLIVTDSQAGNAGLLEGWSVGLHQAAPQIALPGARL